MAKTRRKRVLRRKSKRGGGKEPKEFKIAKVPSKLKRTAKKRTARKQTRKKRTQTMKSPFTIGRGEPRIKSSRIFSDALISPQEQQEINDDWGNYINELQSSIERDKLKKKTEKKSRCVIC